MKRVLRMRVCSTSTTVTSGHGIILMLSANVGPLQRQRLGWYCRVIVVDPYLLPDRLTAQRYRVFLETVLPGCLKMCL
jgi:hypothetical protein